MDERTEMHEWEEALEQGLEDVRQGRVVPVRDVIADIDAVLAEMDVADGQ